MRFCFSEMIDKNWQPPKKYTHGDEISVELAAKSRASVIAEVDKSWNWKISRNRWFLGWKELNPYERSIMISLWVRSGTKRYSWSSLRRLALELGVDKKTVQRAVRSLEKKGFVRIERKAGTRGRYNCYYLLK
jgi:hypothetical protein